MCTSVLNLCPDVPLPCQVNQQYEMFMSNPTLGLFPGYGSRMFSFRHRDWVDGFVVDTVVSE